MAEINYVSNLNDQAVRAMPIKVAVPSTDRIVILMDLREDGTPLHVSARYRQGNWYGVMTEQIINGLNDHAVWGESFTLKHLETATFNNRTGEPFRSEQ
jgi:hypothetical protein